MATGFMAFRSERVGARRHFTLLAALLCAAPVVLAQDVGLAGVMGSKAMLTINGSEPRAVSVGQSVEGVKVLSVQGDQAVVEIGGRKRPLRVGQNATGAASPDGSGKVTLNADGQGHFFTTGSINGTSVRFMVDTGASMISLGVADARRIGLDPNRGEKALTSTANGQAVVTRVKLDTVRVGDITMNNIDALIHQSDLPIALLGMSFLSRMDMQQEGSTMTLKKRF
jgi:aspartyl protease family protein